MIQIQAWTTYIAERLHLAFTLILILGFCASCAIFSNASFQLFPLFFSSFLLLYLVFYLRLKNDLEDFEKDCIAHRDRPLCRGVISKKSAFKMLKMLRWGLIFLFFICMIFFSIAAKLWLLILAVYLWLLEHPMKFWGRFKSLFYLQKILAQGIVFPVIFVLGGNLGTVTPLLIGYSFAVYGAFFTFDVCRKLDPFAHPATPTLIQYYGFHFTFFLTLIMLIVSAIAAFFLGKNMWLWPCEIAVFLSLTHLFKKPEQFRFAEIASGLSLAIHIWSGVLP
jgi:4-hydroxybenzoate polyprenyltransferase